MLPMRPTPHSVYTHLFLSVLALALASGCSPSSSPEPGADGGLDGSVCAAGTTHCGCRPDSDSDGACDRGLVCDAASMLCTRCPADQAGCPCEDDACQGMLVCDSTTSECRDALNCEDIGCMEGQFCSFPALNSDAECSGCEPGMIPAAGGGCEDDPAAHCGTNEGSIVAACLALGRECTSHAAQGATCGDCSDPTFVLAGSMCRAPVECTSLNCTSENRLCVDATPGDDAECGSCRSGYVLVGANCFPDTCSGCTAEHRACVGSGSTTSCGACTSGYVEVDESCEPQRVCAGAGGLDETTCAPAHRTCVEDPNARCAQSCVAGYVWDVVLRACRAPRGCCPGAAGCVSCPGAQQCEEGDLSTDASCSGATCPNGDGLTRDGTCEMCSSGQTSPSLCSDAGFTGDLLRDSGGRCFCEPALGHYLDANGFPVECDQDGDGFIRDEVLRLGLASCDGSSGDASRQARCALNCVDTVELRPERYPIAPSSTLTPDNPLGLFESARNDGAASSPISFYGATRPHPSTVNAFTKLCAENGDFNDNGVSDVSEWHGSTLGSRVTVPSLQETYGSYADYSYFLELHTGIFLPGTTAGACATSADCGSAQPSCRLGVCTGPGTYRISERARDVAYTGGAVPVRYDALSASSDYWSQCGRHTDAYYDVDVAAANAGPGEVPDATVDVGGDFADVSDWMHHHSQYKCVLLTSQAAYASDGRSIQSNPEVVYQPTSGDANCPTTGLCRRHQSGGATEGAAWTLNDVCAISGAGAATSFACTPVDPGTVVPVGVYWAAVRYEAGVPVQGAAAHTYLRGCRNECVELGIAECDNNPENIVASDPTRPWDSERFDCATEAAASFGDAMCGCGQNYAGSTCEIGCPDEELHSRRTIDTEGVLAGEWMCGHPTLSQAITLSGGGYTLRGEVPISAADDTVLSGGGYRLHPSLGAPDDALTRQP